MNIEFRAPYWAAVGVTPKHRAVHDPVREQGHRGGALLKQRPEDDGGNGQDDQHDHALALDAVTAIGDEPGEAREHRQGQAVQEQADGGVELQHLPDHSDGDDGAGIDAPFPVETDRRASTEFRPLGWLREAAQVALAVDERRQSQQHADAGGAETVGPAEGFP
jgi:hypothetical protein